MLFDFSFGGVGWAVSMLLMRRLFRFDRFKGFSITGIDPALVSESGLVYLERGINHERIFFVWIVVGFMLIVWASYHFAA